MKKITNIIMQLPKWYGICIVLVYSLLLAEMFSIIIRLTPVDDAASSIFEIFARINYGVTFLSGVIIWLVSSLLYHLTALLFNGQASFGQMTRVTSYPFIVPALVILSAIFILDGMELTQTEDFMAVLAANSKFKLAMNLINYSFAPYYVIVALFIKHVYQIKYLYAALSVVTPVGAIWGVTELFKLL